MTLFTFLFSDLKGVSQYTIHGEKMRKDLINLNAIKDSQIDYLINAIPILLFLGTHNYMSINIEFKDRRGD